MTLIGEALQSAAEKAEKKRRKLSLPAFCKPAVTDEIVPPKTETPPEPAPAPAPTPSPQIGSPNNPRPNERWLRLGNNWLRVVFETRPNRPKRVWFIDMFDDLRETKLASFQRRH